MVVFYRLHFVSIQSRALSSACNCMDTVVRQSQNRRSKTVSLLSVYDLFLLKKERLYTLGSKTVSEQKFRDRITTVFIQLQALESARDCVNTK